MSCRTLIQELEKDSCRALNIPSHDAEVPIRPLLMPACQCIDVPSRPVSVLKRWLRSDALEEVQFSVGLSLFFFLQILNCLYFESKFFQEFVGVVYLSIIIRKLKQLPRIPPSRYHDVEPVL